MAGEDREYRKFVETLPCCAPGAPDACMGRIDAHHAGKNPGLGMRAHDHTCIPLCRKHHTEWDAPDFSTSKGAFHLWSAEMRVAWRDEQIARTRDLWEKRQSGVHYEAMAF